METNKTKLIASLILLKDELAGLSPDVSPDISLCLGQRIGDIETLIEFVNDKWVEDRVYEQTERVTKRVISLTQIVDLDTGYIFSDGGSCPICNGHVRRVNLACQERDDGFIIHPFYLQCEGRCKKTVYSEGELKREVVQKVKTSTKQKTRKRVRVAF